MNTIVASFTATCKTLTTSTHRHLNPIFRCPSFIRNSVFTVFKVTFYFLVVRIPAMATGRSATDKEVVIAEVAVCAVARRLLQPLKNVHI